MRKHINIYFDMDGTISNLYGVDNWEEKLQAKNWAVYNEAEPMQNAKEINELIKRIKKIHKDKVTFNIISWGCRGENNYREIDKIATCKMKWLKKHFPALAKHISGYHIIKYGTPKSFYAEPNATNILFDDEIKNRIEWHGVAYEPCTIETFLRSL